MFARSFEAHIDRKLQALGRANTYLTQTPDSLLWPTAEQSAAMAPAFDRLMAAVRAEHFADAPKRNDARGVRIDRFMAALERNTPQKPRKQPGQTEPEQKSKSPATEAPINWDNVASEVKTMLELDPKDPEDGTD
jgi:hypothetical protein